jgi:predicted alpha/beta-hydrolase family hydrolase
VFVQGARDPFGSIEEVGSAIKLIPARTKLIDIAGAGHDLKNFAWAKLVPGAVAGLL